MKIPGPDHPITITPFKGRVTVLFKGAVVAQTDNALSLKEASYPEVFYIPRSDIRVEHYERTAHQTHCPYKGQASYYSVKGGPENAIWTYENPYEEMLAIKDLLAFYPNKVDSILTG